ncbi:MAG: glycosyltransferase [Planctomycetota bacterium]
MTNPDHVNEDRSTGARRVLFLHPSAEFRGADRTLLHLVAALDRTRWEPVVALPRRGPLIGELEALGAHVEVGNLGVVGHGFGGTRWLSLLARLPLCLFFVWRLVRRHRAPLVHTTSTAVLGGAFGARLFAPRHVWHVHRVLGRGFRARMLARTLRALAPQIVCSSAAARDALEAALPALGERCWLVRSAVDERRVAAPEGARRETRAKLGVEEGTTLVLVVGPMGGAGGHADVVDAVESLRYSQPDLRVVAVDDATAPSRAHGRAFDALVESRGLEGVVSRVPAARDLAALYAAADVVCVPRHDEDPFHAVALEAIGARRPIVSTLYPGADEYVRTGANGLLYEAGDVERLAWSLASLAGDPNRRAAMAAAAADLSATEFILARFRNEIDRVWSSTSGREFVLPKTRARVVHFVIGRANPDRQNGVNKVVHELASTQAELGMNVEVWGLAEDPDAPTPTRPYATRFFRRGRARFRLPEGLSEAISELDTTAVAHLQGAFLPELFTVGKRLHERGVPFAITPHGAYLPGALQVSRIRKAVWFRLFGRRHLARARAVQVFSGRELVAMEKRCDVSKLRVVPNGQRALPFPAAPPPDAADATRPVFAYCGRLSAHTKGLDALLQGFARYVAARGSGTLWIVGDGRDRAALESLADDLGVTRRVRFFGALFGEERDARIAAADAFVHPSRHEGMPTAVLEAGSLGRPVIVTPGTNLDNDVRRALAGFVVPEPTAEAIARTLAEVEAEARRGTLAGFGQNAAWLVSSHFAWPRIAALVARDLYGIDDVEDPELAAPTDPAEPHEPRRRSA